MVSQNLCYNHKEIRKLRKSIDGIKGEIKTMDLKNALLNSNLFSEYKHNFKINIKGKKEKSNHENIPYSYELIDEIL